MYWNRGRKVIKQPSCRLTLTWDVLKSSNITLSAQDHSRLTLTWDVLKSAVISIK